MTTPTAPFFSSDLEDIPTFMAVIKELLAVFSERDDLRATTSWQQEKIASLQDQLSVEKDRNERAAANFGEAFLGHTVGPNRVNRPKLSAEDAQRIREVFLEGYKLKDIADMFDVHPSTVSRIVKGVYYGV